MFWIITIPFWIMAGLWGWISVKVQEEFSNKVPVFWIGLIGLLTIQMILYSIFV